MSVIDELWDGELSPLEHLMPKTKRYSDANKRSDEAKEKISEMLTEEYVQELEEMLDAICDESDELAKEAYRMGIKFGFELCEMTAPLCSIMPQKRDSAFDIRAAVWY